MKNQTNPVYNPFLLGASVMAFMAAIVFSINREVIITIVLFALSLVSLSLFVLNNFSEIKLYFSSRSGKAGFETSLNVLIVFAISIGIYLLFYFEIANIRIDLTKEKLFTISEQSKQILNRLEFPVEVLVFNINENKDSMLDLLKRYKHSNKNFHYRFIDLTKNPELAKEHGVRRQGTLVFTAENRTAIKISYADMVKQTYDDYGRPKTEYRFEEKIASCLLGLIDTKNATVYFTTGHGELDIENFEERGLSSLKERLEVEKITSVKLDLIKEGSIPEDADLIVIAGPRGKFTAGEISMLDQFLQNRKALFLMLDPKIDINVETGLEKLYEKYGMIINDDAVVDTVNFLPQLGQERGSPLYPIIAYDYHQIVNDLSRANMNTIFFSARSVSKKAGLPENYVYNTVLNGSENAWGETTFSGKSLPKYDEGKDIRPVCMGAVIQIRGADNNYKLTTNEIRLAFFGDSEFANNSVIDMAGHKDLFINTVRWLMNQENFITIRPRESVMPELYVPHSERLMVTLFFLVVLPLGIAVSGGIFIYKRKRKKRSD